MSLLGMALVGLCQACQKRESSGVTIEKSSEESPVRLSLGSIIFPKESNYIVTPLGLKTDRAFEVVRKLKSSREYQRNPFLTTNLIFHNKVTGSSHLLLDRKAIISHFEDLSDPQKDENNEKSKTTATPKEANNSPEKSPQFWLYQIIEKDTNADERLTDRDATLLYLSDRVGKNLQAITPENTQLSNWKLYREDNLLLLEVRQDSNQDREFTETDTKLLYLYDLSTKTLRRITPEKTQLQMWNFDYPQDKLIFVTVRHDSNNDGKFTAKDASLAYLYNLSTQKLHQIVPDNTQLQEWQLDENSQFIFLKIRQDSDNNNEFTDEDESTIVNVKVTDPTLQINVIDKQLQEQIKSLEF
ncbi:hypothetical protein IQ249_17750 [Lusitaniella coriacea LEGE 07157]|uniref:Uncharacterized protein n=1 Tax=Lusitaniella coriacea LEGE 07157 TaxID=945747 RepID=A0A8J7JCM2_9CYAN|nr:hypothetical protein [Lusitaniella coriacea]MBE9117745.1 hypothetical protein [Lusitaniella coriacea LEGE 07157]